MSSFPPNAQRKRDFELCKVIFGAALSQILYARRSFAPTMFQLLPMAELLGPQSRFEAIIATGSRVDRHDRELLRDQNNFVFLRAEASNYDLSHFLAILTTDIFGLLEKGQLVKFRLSFLSSPTLSEESLVEYYTFVIKYMPGGKYNIDIWRAGAGKQHISTLSLKLWNLGDYLSRLPSLSDPIYCTLAFHAKERPADPAIGLWGFGRSHFEDANIRLQQSDGYSFERIATLKINALPLGLCNPKAYSTEGERETTNRSDNEKQEAETRKDTTAEETLADDRPPEEDELDEAPPREETLPAMVPKEVGLGEAVFGENAVEEEPLDTRLYELRHPSGVLPSQAQETHRQETQPTPRPAPRKATKAGAKKAQIPKPRADPKPKTKPKPKEKTKPKAKAPRANHSTSRGQKNGKASTKGLEKDSPAKFPEEVADNVLSSGKKIATKRKPKAPLQLEIYEEVNSNMTETQPAARLSQLKSQTTESRKRERGGDLEVPTNSRSKRLKSSPRLFSALSSMGNPRSNSPAINDPSSHGIMSPDNTQSQSEQLVEASPTSDLSDEDLSARRQSNLASRSGRPGRPVEVVARQKSIFADFVDSTSSGNEDEDEDEGDTPDSEFQEMLVAPPSCEDSCHGAGASTGEVSVEPVVDGQLLFAGVVVSDSDDDEA